MRDILRAVTRQIRPPSEAERAEATANWGSREAHDRYQGGWSCLTEVEVVPPADPPPKPPALTVAAWNIERCKDVEEAAAVISGAGAEVVLATELDHGMARSGQRHTPRDLAAALGWGYAFGVEFVELGLGDAYETERHAGESNLHGLHGNAILSRWPLHDVAVIPLDDGGYWFEQAPKNDGQYRVGGRNAVAARIDTAAGPLALASVHLESESDADGRAAQIVRLLDAFAGLYGDMPAVIGGDLNTRGFLEAGMTGGEMLADPLRAEPCFGAFADAGFDWRGCNTGQTTTRQPPWAGPAWRRKTLDWLFVRGVGAGDPAVVPAVTRGGAYLSDHELVSARITP